MPAGRLGAVADPVWRGGLHFGVSERSLRRYRSKSTAKGRPDAGWIRQWRRRAARRLPALSGGLRNLSADGDGAAQERFRNRQSSAAFRCIAHLEVGGRASHAAGIQSECGDGHSPGVRDFSGGMGSFEARDAQADRCRCTSRRIAGGGCGSERPGCGARASGGAFRCRDGCS
jgi:hypothetical protein